MDADREALTPVAQLLDRPPTSPLVSRSSRRNWAQWSVSPSGRLVSAE